MHRAGSNSFTFASASPKQPNYNANVRAQAENWESSSSWTSEAITPFLTEPPLMKSAQQQKVPDQQQACDPQLGLGGS